jgi:nuclear GTP-binding protein
MLVCRCHSNHPRPAKPLQAEEAKEARRLAQKEAAAAGAAARQEVDSDDDNPGIVSLHGRKAVNPPIARIVEELAVVAEDPPPLVDAELPTIQSALDKADAVIQVLDARDPQSFRSAFLENLITETNGKDKLLFVLNKVDLIPRESSTAWLRHLRSSIPAKLRGSIKACLLKSSVKSADDLSEGMQSKAVPWGRSRLLQILEEWAAEKLKKGGEREGFTVTVMGLPNVSGMNI